MDTLEYYQMPHFVEKTEYLLAYLKTLSYAELKSIWKCNDSITEQNYRRVQMMNLHKNLPPCLLSYTGLQFNYISVRYLRAVK